MLDNNMEVNMKFPLTKILFFSILGLSIVEPQSYESWRMGLIANPQYPNTSDVWGYTDENGHDFAVFGVFDGTVILDISTNPSNPVETGYITGDGSIWRDLKTHGDYLYVTNESGGGLDIIDLTDPWNPYLAGQFSETFSTAHNLYIADGYAYIVGANDGSGGIRILDLADPVNPVEVGSWETTYIHDLYVKNDTVYACAIYTGDLFILDVSDKANIQIIAVIDYDTYGCHAVWATDDLKFIITADEKSGGHVKIWDANDYNNINLASEFELGNGKSVHNIFVRDDKMFLSYYVFGTRVVDISDPYNPVEVAYFDNYPGSDGTYSGNWGTYPFSNSGLVYSTSMSGHGFFILQYPMFVEFAHEQLLDTEDVVGPYDLSVTINPIEGNVLVDGTAMAVSGLNDVFADTTFLTTGTDAGEYEASLPGHGGEAGIFSYYFSVLDTAGRWSTLPFGAPESHYSFNVGPDAVLPVIHSVSDLNDLFGRSGSEDVSTYVTDNIGVGDVFLEYIISNNPQMVHSVLMSYYGTEWRGTITWEDVPWHTIISYWVKAVDSSSQFNEQTSTIQSFTILNWMAIGNWEDEDLSGWDTGESWGFFGIGAVGWVMNDSPDGVYENNSNNILSRIDAVDISLYESAYLSFWQLSLLEEDKDFGYVELSPDGLNWEIVSTITGIGVQRDQVLDISSYIPDGQVWLRFRMTSDEQNVFGGWFIDDVIFLVDTTIDVASIEPINIVPDEFALEQNYPNPFNASTVIPFKLPQAAGVELVIYDILGGEVATLVNSWQTAGQHKVVWNASDVASGIYFYRLVVRQDGILSYANTKKLIVLK